MRGVNTESSYNWQSREWSVPVSLTVTQLLKLGGQPLTVQAGLGYWLDSPENGRMGVMLFTKRSSLTVYWKSGF